MWFNALLLLTSLALVGTALADAPPLPPDVTLTSGAVLHNISVVRWGKDSVTLKHDGGADPIRYANIIPEQRAAFEAGRDYDAVHPPVAKADPSTTITGQSFVNTNEGPIKMGSLNVYAFPESALAAFDPLLHREYGAQLTVSLPKPLASTLTDGDGNFRMKVPGSDPIVIFAYKWQLLGTGHYNSPHLYFWVIAPADVTPDIVLSQDMKVGPLEASVTFDIATQ